MEIARQERLQANLTKKAQEKADRDSVQSGSMDPGFGLRQRWLYRRYHEKGKGARRFKELPYVKIHVAFNHKNAFVNVHGTLEGHEGNLDGCTVSLAPPCEQ